MPEIIEEIVQTDFEVEVQARIDAERARLRAAAGLARMREFKKPVERTFTAAEREMSCDSMLTNILSLSKHSTKFPIGRALPEPPLNLPCM